MLTQMFAVDRLSERERKERKMTTKLLLLLLGCIITYIFCLMLGPISPITELAIVLFLIWERPQKYRKEVK